MDNWKNGSNELPSTNSSVVIKIGEKTFSASFFYKDKRPVFQYTAITGDYVTRSAIGVEWRWRENP